MIYFVVNNNYQLIDFKKHLTELKKEEVTLIQIPHTLELEKNNSEFKTFEYPSINGKKYLNPINYFNVINRVKREIKPKEEDVLFIYTEYELLNQFLAYYFKKSKAKVFLLEEGLATYLESCFLQKDIVPIKTKIIEKYIKWILGMQYTRISNSNTLSKYFINDSIFDGILLYFNIKPCRKIKKYSIKNNALKINNLDTKKVIFLNEDMYNFYENFETYLFTLKSVLESLSNNFEVVYFKFHPREYKEAKIIEEITKMIIQIKNIEIINKTEPIELIVGEIKPKFVVSYMSVGLINLYFMGLEPIYIYSAIENLKKEEDFIKTTEFLKLINYNFIKEFKDINSQYESKIKYNENESISLVELLELK